MTYRNSRIDDEFWEVADLIQYDVSVKLAADSNTVLEIPVSDTRQKAGVFISC